MSLILERGECNLGTGSSMCKIFSKFDPLNANVFYMFKCQNFTLRLFL